MIGIIDYGMGNLRSVYNALDYVGLDAEIVGDAERLADYDHLILPGVGAFALAMQNLHSKNLVTPIREYIAAGKPFLGICLGMQLLASRGIEFGDSEGLNAVPGEVVPMDDLKEFPVPHVGWNNLEIVRNHPVYEGVKKDVDFYFVHSYHFQTPSDEWVIGTTDYGSRVVAAVAKGSVVGFQFHPEKSQAGGIALLENFANWDGSC
ncbi:MAG: imidazole glycerol phosphate synthase subunit HisH [Chthonomonadales bacterium]